MVGTGGATRLPRSESQKIDRRTLQSKFAKEYDASIRFRLAGGDPMTTRRTFLIAGGGAFAVPLPAGGGGNGEPTDLADPEPAPPQAPPITPPPPAPTPEPPSSAPPGYEDPIVIYDGKMGITGM